MVLVLVAGGARLGVGLPEGDPDVLLAPGGAGGITLPIEYPVGEELPNLGDAPGPLAAVWLTHRAEVGGAPEAVGLVAETGTFGTLPIDLSLFIYEAPVHHLALTLSPDGRRVAYFIPTEGSWGEDDPRGWQLVVRDLVSGEDHSDAFEFGVRPGVTWLDSTRLVGWSTGGDTNGWIWEPGTAPKRVNPHTYLDWPGGLGPPVVIVEGDPPCRSPGISDHRADHRRTAKSVLCDELGVIGHEVLLGHLNSGYEGPDNRQRPVVALDVRNSADWPFDDPALRRVVVSPGAPHPVTFAVDLLAQALEADGDGS